MFRTIGLTKGKFSKVFILCNYAGYLTYTVYFFVFRPSYMLAINTSDYRCTEADKNWFMVMIISVFLFYPLCLMLLFFGLFLQMVRINDNQPTSVEKLNNIQDDESLVSPTSSFNGETE